MALISLLQILLGFREALQEISKELSDVSAAYSAKCLENSRMEDELEDAKRILDQMA